MNDHFSCDEDIIVDLPLKSMGLRIGFSSQQTCLPRTAYFPKQVHGREDYKVGKDSSHSRQPEADIIWTELKEVPVAVQTADCMPVLLGAPGRMCMAVHAGWRGLKDRILTRALTIFREQGVSTDVIQVRVGPFIGFDQFEVGPEVVDAFEKSFSSIEDFDVSGHVKQGEGDRLFLNLKTIARHELTTGGIERGNIEFVDICTKSQTSWHSYRRDSTQAKRNWAWISLGDNCE